MCRLNIFLLLILPIFTNVHINGSQEPNDRVYVKLNDKIRIAGKIERTLDNVREFEAFKGIRYAKAPLGTLRFQDPVPEEYGGGVINAISYGSSCPQISLLGKYIGDEDCLFLNIFVPKERKVPLPVMVFIHGGGFKQGESSEYGPDYFMNKNNVILVTINYRLGALGFLSLGDDSISGNMGIKDQFESLKWIKEHIKSFGGDENSITIFGSSAGGISVLTLMMAAHKVPGLFHKVISQSTPMIDAPFMHLTHNPSYYSLLFSNEMGCDSENSIDISKCLKEKDVYELINKQDMFEKFMNFPYPWKPVVDFEYASKPLFSMGFVDLIKHGLFTNVPLLMGGTSEEGAMFSPEFFKNDEEKFQELNENFDITGATLLMGIDEADVTDEDSATVNIINIEYLDSDNITYSSENILKLVKMLTDVHFLGPIDKQVQLFANSSHGPIFYYNYRYKGSHSTSIKGLDLGASHGDELFLLFKIQDISLSTEDKKMSDLLIDYWTSFAIHGSPNSKWTPVSNAVAPKYVILNNPSSTIVAKRESYFNERMAFISSTNDIIKSYRNFDLESHPAIKSVMEREVENEEESEEELSKDEL
uniref:Carboxylic ester hydrolase n=1 Tax=Lepeophtheirus salmonis TaxID=72036 RepID=A0A0K2TJB1_LEPSM